MRTKILALVTAGVVLAVGTSAALSATVSGSVSFYSDPFTSGTITHGNTSATYSWSTDANLFDADYSSNARATRNAAGGSTSDVGYWQSQLGSPVAIDAVVSFANYAQGATTPTYDIKLGSTTVQLAVPVTLLGNVSFAQTSLATPISASTARLEFTNVGTVTGDIFQSSALICLQKTASANSDYALLQKLTVTGTASSAILPTYVPSNTLDTSTSSQWISPSSNLQVDRWIEFDFAKAFKLDTVIFDNQRAGQIVDLQRWDGSTWVTFGTLNDSASWAALKVNLAVPTTDRVRFFWDSGKQTFAADTRVATAMFFGLVPEPGALTLLVFGCAWLTRRRR